VKTLPEIFTTSDMNKLDHCYLEALSEALKGNLGEALELRNEADALASEGFSFSENYGNKYPFIEEAVNTLLGSYDFTRCVRPDGSAYGTRGKCKKGAEQAKQPVEKKAKNNKERKEAIKEKRLTSNATWRLMRQVLDTPEVKSQFSSLEKKGDVEGARALYSKIEAEAIKKANAKEGRLAKGDSKTPAARKSEAMAQRAAETKAKAKEPARRWVNNREFAQAGVMHPNMASEMKVGMSTDFYDKKTGDKMSGKVVSNDGKFISIKADKDGREAAGSVQRFKIAREAGSPELQ
jgi:hypothetical protein